MYGAFLYMVGTAVLIPANALLFFSGVRHLASIVLFIVATGLLFLGAIVDICLSCCKRRPEADADELTGLVNEKVKIQSRNLPLSTILVLITYLMGGGLFLSGAILFLPHFPATVGVWLFRFGSICYSIGSIIMLIVLRNSTNVPVLKASLVVYLIGSCAFLTGGVLSQIGLSVASSAVWMVGSVSFAVGGVLGFVHAIKK
jgi:hypothetical protein